MSRERLPPKKGRGHVWRQLPKQGIFQTWQCRNCGMIVGPPIRFVRATRRNKMVERLVTTARPELPIFSCDEEKARQVHES